MEETRNYLCARSHVQKKDDHGRDCMSPSVCHSSVMDIDSPPAAVAPAVVLDEAPVAASSPSLSS
jgi:hypothetical protein